MALVGKLAAAPLGVLLRVLKLVLAAVVCVGGRARGSMGAESGWRVVT